MDAAINFYLACWRKFADFDGRAQRAEFWFWVLFNVIIAFAISIVTRSELIGGLFNLVTLVPGLAVSVRRLHDIGKSGWLLAVFVGAFALSGIVGFVMPFLLMAMPLVFLGLLIWFIVLFATDSNPGTNAYGPNPKETAPAPMPISPTDIVPPIEPIEPAMPSSASVAPEEPPAIEPAEPAASTGEAPKA